MIVKLLSDFFLLVGSVSILISAIGILRFPDFYTRIHAAGITESFGIEFVLLGLILQTESWLVAVKLVLIAFFLMFTSPTATHALVHAAHESGLKARLGKKLKKE